MNLHCRPLFPITMAYIAGIVCAVQGHLPLAAGVLLGAGLLVAALVAPADRVPRAVLILLGAMFLAGIVRGSAYRTVPADDVSRLAEDKLVYITGTIASDPEPRTAGGVRFVLEAASVKTYTGAYSVGGRTMVVLYRPRWAPEDTTAGYVPFYGDRVRIHGRLSPPQASRNPGMGSYAGYLSRRRVFCTVSSPMDSVERLGARGGVIGRTVARFKAALSSRVYRLFPGVLGSLMLGLLLGNYVALPLGVQAAFMRTGTMHLLAASGYNCGVIVLIFRWIMQRLTVPRAWMHVLLIALLWGFALVAGGGPSIVRATIMVTVFLSAYLLWRAADMLSSVLLAGLIITIANPLSLYDVGFQLSFAAVIAIILAMPLIEPIAQPLVSREPLTCSAPGRLLISAGRWITRTAVGALLLSVATALGTLPITACYFNYVSVISVVANAAVALAVVMLTVVGLASVTLSWIWTPAAVFVAFLGRLAAEWMLTVITGLSAFSWSSYSVRSPSWEFVLCYYVALIAALEYAHRRTGHGRRSGNVKTKRPAAR